MSDVETLDTVISQDIWKWLMEFVTVKNEFYHKKFAPCPYARSAILQKQVDVKVHMKGDIRAFIREKSLELRDTPELSTRVISFPPRIQYQWGISEYVETLNAELIADGVFLNTGTTKTMSSRYPGSNGKDPYFIVVANRLDAVLQGSDALQRTGFYKDWPKDQYELVVERRDRMAKRYGKA
jgi:hypothetical protein